MADLAVKMKHIASADIVLFEIGAALLGLLFYSKWVCGHLIFG